MALRWKRESRREREKFRLRRAVACLLVLVTPAMLSYAGTQGEIARKIDELIAQTPAVQRGHFGFEFVELATGEVLAERDADDFFTPASNTKLYTTSLALVRLGPDYRFKTELRTGTSWTQGQPILRDLELIGGGDPNLSGRVLPYVHNSVDGDALGPLSGLADQLVAAGVREIDGDVTGVATRYPGDLYPDGWTVDDAVYGYGAPVSALSVNDSLVTLTARGTEPGEMPEIEFRPATSHFVILNEATTDTSRETHLSVARAAGSNEVVLWGTIGQVSAAWEQDLALEDPALFAAEALVDLLRERGVVVRGEARAEYRDLNEVPSPLLESPGASQNALLAARESAPLAQIIQVTNKVSQNLHAEMLLREVARVTHGVGTLEAGLRERENFLRDAGVTAEGTGLALVDGSGLARGDLTTPLSTVTLLRYMWARPERDVWLASLPIGGVDGTLDERFKGVAGAERVHAKTGSLSHVNALSGYIETREHGWIAFSVMVNATVAHQAEVRGFIDKICAMFL